MEEDSQVSLQLRSRAPDSDKLFRILFAAIQIGEPASKRRIAETADLSSQLVDYHIDKLVAKGLLLFDGKQYRPQAAFNSKRIYKTLTDGVLQQKLVEQVAGNLDLSQKEVPDNVVLEEAILTLLRLFTIRLEEQGQG